MELREMNEGDRSPFTGSVHTHSKTMGGITTIINNSALHWSKWWKFQKSSDDSAIIQEVSEGYDQEKCKQLKKNLCGLVWGQSPQVQHLKISGAGEHSGSGQTLLGLIQISGCSTQQWTGLVNNMETLHRKNQTHLHMLRGLRSFGVSRGLLRSFSDMVVASAVFYAMVCWGRDLGRTGRGWISWSGEPALCSLLSTGLGGGGRQEEYVNVADFHPGRHLPPSMRQ